MLFNVILSFRFYIDKEERLLRPKNLFEPAPGKGFQIYKTKNDIKIGVLNLMGNVFMKKCEDVFEASQKFLRPLHLLLVRFSVRKLRGPFFKVTVIFCLDLEEVANKVRCEKWQRHLVYGQCFWPRATTSYHSDNLLAR